MNNIDHSIFLLTYYLLTYLLKSNPGNPVPATGYPVPKPVHTSNHYYAGCIMYSSLQQSK